MTSKCLLHWFTVLFPVLEWNICVMHWFIIWFDVSKKDLLFFPPLGEAGLGKSTLINSMFLTDIYSSEYPGPSQRIKKTLQVCNII